MSGTVADPASLRSHYPAPIERAVLKSLPRLDHHMRRFIALSPFVCIGTSSEAGADVSPRGDSPGFVHVIDDTTLLIPDWPGNNRLDSWTNLVSNPQVGLLFMIPGVTETLRVSGVGELTADEQLLRSWEVRGKHPRAVLRVSVREAFLHCGKALIRSRLWDTSSVIPRDQLPTYAQMLKDQITVRETAEQLEEAIRKGYTDGLY